MSIKPKINSLRCQKWYGFCKRKFLQFKELGISSKAYVIDGYHIFLKILINLAVIKAPPGLAIFHKASGAVDIYYADMYGKGKEIPAKINSLRDFYGEKPLNPKDDGWPGSILAQTFGGWDAMRLLFGGRPENLLDNPPYFTTRTGFNLRVFPGAPYAVGFDSGFLAVVQDTSLPHVWNLVNIGKYYAYINYGETKNYDAGFVELYFGWGKNKPPGGYLIFDDVAIPKQLIPSGTEWTITYCQYAYLWKHFNSIKGRDVALAVYFIQGLTPPQPLSKKGMAAMFFEVDPQATYPNDFTYVGYTDHTALYLLPPFSEKELATDILALDFCGAPSTQANNYTKLKNVVIPLANGEIMFAHCEPPNITYPLGRITQVVFTQFNTPYVTTAYNIPYVYNEFINPFCVRVNEFPPPALYLYWEEEMLFGGEETDVINLKYGSPYASWIDMPLLGSGWHMTNFAVYEFSWDRKLILATAFNDGPVQEGGGMYTALLDTKMSSNWIFGQRFSETRLDRCTPVIFGEHPYILKTEPYGGTQFGWDYSYCENYPEPPGGYP